MFTQKLPGNEIGFQLTNYQWRLQTHITAITFLKLSLVICGPGTEISHIGQCCCFEDEQNALMHTQISSLVAEIYEQQMWLILPLQMSFWWLQIPGVFPELLSTLSCLVTCCITCITDHPSRICQGSSKIFTTDFQLLVENWWVLRVTYVICCQQDPQTAIPWE